MLSENRTDFKLDSTKNKKLKMKEFFCFDAHHNTILPYKNVSKIDNFVQAFIVV